MGKRNPNAHSRRMPGGLIQSIDYEVTRENGGITGSVFVSENAKAKDYAAIIHDAKHILWNERGVGTVKRGPRADEKFIERAMDAKEPSISAILESEISKALEAQ